MAGNAGAFRLRGYNDYWDGWLARTLERPYRELENELWKAGWSAAASLTDADRGAQFVLQMQRTFVGMPAFEPYILLDEVPDV